MRICVGFPQGGRIASRVRVGSPRGDLRPGGYRHNGFGVTKYRLPSRSVFRFPLMIAHRLSTLRSVDEILVFDHGRIVEHGSRIDLIGDDDSRFANLLTLSLEREGTDPTSEVTS